MMRKNQLFCVLDSISYLYTICFIRRFYAKQLETGTQNITSFIAKEFFLVLLVTSFTHILCLCVFIVSRYASITLGEEGEDPEFSLPSWFAMLFSAGMGIGLVFWTTAEPISHAFTLTLYIKGTQSAINDAFQFSFFHWGLHAWAVYGIVALVFAYFVSIKVTLD